YVTHVNWILHNNYQIPNKYCGWDRNQILNFDFYPTFLFLIQINFNNLFFYKFTNTIVLETGFLIGEHSIICYIYVVIITKGVSNHENI
ncbi:hypothetical protein BUY85_12245, partial [Staphylococcus equorum]